MKVQTLLLLTVLILAVYAQDYMSFDDFIVKFKKPYVNGTEEYAQKKIIFNFNIQQLKQKNCSQCGVTKFFDVASSQFTKRQLDLLMPQVKASANINDENPGLRKLSAPPSIDWRQKGIITSIKEQGDCGCCWSFATIALSESYMILQGRADRNIDLSQQYLLRCTPEGDCDGGYLQNALKQVYVKGAPPDSKYPYKPFSPREPDICTGSSNVKVTTQAPRSYYDLSTENIKNLLIQGPLAIAIDSTDWQYYTRGTWKCRGKDVNHAVLLVGYTSDNRWIIKNQWGQDWGQNGYIYVSMNPYQNCKIGTAVHKFGSSSSNQINYSQSNFQSLFPSIFKSEMMLLLKGFGLVLLFVMAWL